VVVVGWALSLSLSFLVVLIGHTEYKDGGESWSPSQNVAYDTLARNTFSLCLAWMIFACHIGYGGQLFLFVSNKDNQKREAEGQRPTDPHHDLVYQYHQRLLTQPCRCGFTDPVQGDFAIPELVEDDAQGHTNDVGSCPAPWRYHKVPVVTHGVIIRVAGNVRVCHTTNKQKNVFDVGG
jgi:hypothetical protein